MIPKFRVWHHEIGNTFIQDAVLENKEGDKQ
ncbi:Uncharacterised protein [Streptococcus pneumoniae]|nr:Uncharacterised protein [Streptococcus pneumoniae]CVZ86426.1 Uncharacterised protein [Streptococcus pneumoniae]SNL89323.1 Uncharacterised protein [Streptococcus pneumoniae]